MAITYSEMKEKGGLWACHLCEGTDKWCELELDDNRGAVCERHGVVVPNQKSEVRKANPSGLHD